MTEIPYFEGDFWLNVIEETIKELDQEAREREASEQATGEVGGAPSPLCAVIAVISVIRHCTCSCGC